MVEREGLFTFHRLVWHDIRLDGGERRGEGGGGEGRGGERVGEGRGGERVGEGCIDREKSYTWLYQ